MEVIDALVQTLTKEIAWLQSVLDTSLGMYFNRTTASENVHYILPPDVAKDTSPFAMLIKELELNFDERLVMILAMVPELKPNMLDVFLIKNQNLNSDFSEFGGYKDLNRPGFLPTLETACFILGGYELTTRLQFFTSLQKQHILYRRGILEYDTDMEFSIHQKLRMSPEYLGLFTSGKRKLPEYSTSFPAKEITTELFWDNLIVEDKVGESLVQIKDWLIHKHRILKEWKLEKNLKSGYRTLFYGPPGTGKTFAATLLGRETSRPVFRVDLSLVVSKFIGETEKNLGRLFEEAEHKEWILFFDEADALFGKRSQTSGANDRYANDEVAVESIELAHEGLTIKNGG